MGRVKDFSLGPAPAQKETEGGQTRRTIGYAEKMVRFDERLTISLRKKYRIEKGNEGGA